MQSAIKAPLKKPATILPKKDSTLPAEKLKAPLAKTQISKTLISPSVMKAPISQSVKSPANTNIKVAQTSKPAVVPMARVPKTISATTIPAQQLQPKIYKKVDEQKNKQISDSMKEEQEIHPNLLQMVQNQNKPSYNLDSGISLEVKSLHKHFQFNSQIDQTLPVMISIKTLDTTNDDEIQAEEEQKLESVKKVETRPSIDLICVIDNSGSMEGEKIKNVKTTLLQLLDMLNENDRLSLVLFNTYPTLLCNLRKVDSENKPQFTRIINSIFSTGGTDITSGMDLAFKVMQKRKFMNPVSSVFLLSDGQDGQADEKIKKILNSDNCSLKNECFTIHSFGFGSDHDGPLMNRICDLKDGNFYYVEQINQIDEFFIDALGGLFSVIAQDILIEININRADANFQKFFKDALVSKTYGEMWKTEKKDEIYSIHLNQLFSGVSKDFIFEITVPKSNQIKLEDFERNLELVKARLTAIPVDIQYTTKVVKDSNLVLTLFCEKETIAEDAELNDNVEFNYFRVKAAEQMAAAIQFSENQQFEQGQLVLQQALQMIEKSHPKNVAKLSVLKKDILDCQESAKPRVYESVGKYKMLSKKAANFKQSSQAVEEDDLFQNRIQKAMVSQQKSKK